MSSILSCFLLITFINGLTSEVMPRISSRFYDIFLVEAWRGRFSLGCFTGPKMSFGVSVGTGRDGGSLPGHFFLGE